MEKKPSFEQPVVIVTYFEKEDIVITSGFTSSTSCGINKLTDGSW